MRELAIFPVVTFTRREEFAKLNGCRGVAALAIVASLAARGVATTRGTSGTLAFWMLALLFRARLLHGGCAGQGHST